MAVALDPNQGWNDSLDWARKRGGCTASEWHANVANCGDSCALANESQHGYHPRTPYSTLFTRKPPVFGKRKREMKEKEGRPREMEKQKKNRKKSYKVFGLGWDDAMIDGCEYCT